MSVTSSVLKRTTLSGTQSRKSNMMTYIEIGNACEEAWKRMTKYPCPDFDKSSFRHGFEACAEFFKKRQMGTPLARFLVCCIIECIDPQRTAFSDGWIRTVEQALVDGDFDKLNNMIPNLAIYKDNEMPG